MKGGGWEDGHLARGESRSDGASRVLLDHVGGGGALDSDNEVGRT